jgi:selenide, water dikinase
MASTSPKVRLTSFSHGAGCACKLGLLDLAQVLQNVPGADDPRVLVDAATRDDAAVYQIAPDRALIATVDFFTPIVDDAASWGAIAATNALSDVYAMGGMPLFALNLVGWPRGKIPFEILGDVITGAGNAAARAGCLVVGGHSIDALEPHFGMAVIGEAHPARLLTNAGARPGDVLVLTKPLGTGVLTTALKRDIIGESDLAEAVRSMTSLNDGAMRAALAANAHAATDVTGFGLVGHLGHVVRASGVAAEIGFEQLPLLDRAYELANRGVVPGGTERNLAAATWTTFADDLNPAERMLCADAQTSGGLLISVAANRANSLTERLRKENTLAASVIGRISDGPAGTIRVSRRL